MRNDNSSSKEPRYLTPKYWGTWVLIGILKLLAKLNTVNQVRLGTVLGKAAYVLVKRRRKITEVNIGLCFPELDERQQESLVRKSINENTIGLLETARAWFVDPDKIRQEVEVEGLENIQNATALGRGVVVIYAHYSTLDLGSALATKYADFTGIYRAQKNLLLDKTMREGRQRFANVVDRKDMRTVIRTLKAGKVLGYAPDQDFGRQVSVFAPFFGVPAATIKTTTQLARINNSPVLLVSFHRKVDNSGYIVRFGEPIENFPSGDEVADATRVNQLIEREIRRCPEQYMWVHRRFKTRPEGSPSLY